MKFCGILRFRGTLFEKHGIRGSLAMQQLRVGMRNWTQSGADRTNNSELSVSVRYVDSGERV